MYFNNYFENLKTIHQYNTRQKSNKDFMKNLSTLKLFLFLTLKSHIKQMP